MSDGVVRLARGANAPLPPGVVAVTLNLNLGPTRFEPSAYVSDAGGRVGWGGAVALAASPDGRATFTLDRTRLGPGVERVAFAATLEAGARLPAAATVEVAVGGLEASYPVGADGLAERALILVEVYRRGGAWKVRAVGQGFAGGAASLEAHFGAMVEGVAAPAPTTSVPATGAAAPAAAAPRVSLSKVTLGKARPTVSMIKDPSDHGLVTVNLNWHRATGGRPVDLDLGCLFEMADGSKGVVQALGNSFGSLDRKPYVRLDGDDRTGAARDGEWLRLADGRWEEVGRLLVFAFIYEGVPDWSATDAVVTVRVPGSPAIEVRLDGDGRRHPLCAVAMIENAAGVVRVTRHVDYFDDQEKMDRAFGWGMRWSPGSKD